MSQPRFTRDLVWGTQQDPVNAAMAGGDWLGMRQVSSHLGPAHAAQARMQDAPAAIGLLEEAGNTVALLPGSPWGAWTLSEQANRQADAMFLALLEIPNETPRPARFRI